MQTIDVDVLMSLAAAVCIATGVIFEGALLTTLYAVSHAAEQWTSRRATRELDSLRDTTPTVALRLASPTATEHTPVPVESIRKGDFVLVKSGELLPCDGQVALGSAFVSMPHITGEATPRRVTIGNTLPAGTRTADAPLVIRVTEVGAESSLARIARLVTAAQENRPRVSRFFDRFGQLYTRSVLIISFTLAAAMPIVTSILSPLVKPVSYAGRNGSAARALSFLVAASPCALVIGAPVAYLAALSACAKRGILAKSGAKSLEAASRVSHVVFDKTGTLTTGQLTLTSAATLPPDSFSNRNSTSNTSYLLNLERASSTVGCLEELEKEDLVRVVSAAAALERGAVHPIATAVQKRAKQLGAPIPQVHQTKVIAGQGVSGVLALNGNDGEQKTSPGVFGRPSYILGDGSSLLKDITRQASWQGETLSVLELDRKKYLFRFKDEIRVESQNLVQSLKQRGVQVSVLTGDAAGAAEFVSSAVGGGVKVFSNATPDGKLEHVTKLQDTLNDTNKGILMVGDGVNDAAALAASLVGVSCGLSSATAVHAADVVLVREELSNIVWFLEKSRRTKAVVLQNYALALGLMVLSAVACIGGAVPLWLAVTLHEGGTVLVGMNGLRLLRDS